MRKQMLNFVTNRYQKWPAWLIIILACIMTQVFMMVGGSIFSLILLIGYGFVKIITHSHRVDFMTVIDDIRFQLLAFAVAALTLRA